MKNTYPEYAALVNPVPKEPHNFGMKFFEPADVYQKVQLSKADPTMGTKVFYHKTFSYVCDAQLFFVPDIQIPKGVDAETWKRLKECRLSFWIDGEQILRNRPVNDFIREKDAFKVRSPWVTRQELEAPKQLLLFYAVEWEPGEHALRPDARALGYFCPNASLLEMHLFGLPHVDLEIEAGAVLGHYTTKAEGFTGGKIRTNGAVKRES